MQICYINGEYTELKNAAVSPLDRGFLFGDGVYDVIPVYQNKPFCTHEHLERLLCSLGAIKAQCQLTIPEWKGIINELIEKNPYDLSYIYMQVTRGAGESRSQIIPKNIQPTVFAFVNPLTEEWRAKTLSGLTAVTMEDTRRKNCYIKSIALLSNTLSATDAVDAGADEPILIRDGFAIESSSSNLFIVKDNIIKTTPLVPNILAGITRRIVLELAATNHLNVKECMITPDELFAADEVWLTSSTREVAPVIKVDDAQIGAGSPGPMWRKMHGLYQEYKASVFAKLGATIPV